MPELPEVETIRRGIEPQLLGRSVTQVVVRERRLRWPIPDDLAARLTGERWQDLTRRSKYLLLGTGTGHLMVHLGMSGRLWLVDADNAPKIHDHVDIILDNGRILRYHDPRRFGSMLWIPATVEATGDSPHSHPLLAHLGPEPLGPDFTADHLYRLSRGRRVAIKNFIMDSRVVVGVGNIYASESLYRAGINPTRAAGRISATRLTALHDAIREVLEAAIRAGGTTLRDFANADGMPGYFQIDLDVYGREGEPCRNCGEPIRRKVIGQRSSFYCRLCQR